MSSETHTRLLETAERLFAERGVYGVSLREIGVEAGQRNTGAVRYHFGTKEQLVNAVFEYRMVPINDRRITMLATQPAGGAYEMRDLAEAFLYPLAETLGDVGRPSWYLRFCIHAAYVEGTAPTDLDAQPWTRGVALLQQRFQRLLDDAGLPELLQAERWGLFTGHMTHALADRELVLQHTPHRLTTQRSTFLANLIDTAVALADAPISEHTARQLEDRRSA